MSRFAPGSRLRRGLAALAVGVVLAGVAAAPARAETVSLTGTVTDAAGNPIAAACVAAFVYQTGVEAARGCTDAGGTYALTVPAVGPYKIRATADTYPELWAYNKLSMESAGGVLLSPDWTAEPINFRLFRQTATVSGRITDSTGAPVEFADVRVVPENSFDVYSAPYDYSDANGFYTVTGVIPGRYRVLFMDNVRGQLYAHGSENRDGATIFELVTESQSPSTTASCHREPSSSPSSTRQPARP